MNAFAPFAGQDAFKRGAFGVSGAAPWVDPLAGYTFALRLQTHRGDGVPLGLYQDAAGTIPATADGHPVGCWKDRISGSGLQAVQATATQRPTLRFSGGLPYVEFDGVDDNLIVTGYKVVVPATVHMRSRFLATTFTKPFVHMPEQWVETYMNGGGNLVMSNNGANGVAWTAATDAAYTHAMLYAATSEWWVDGGSIGTAALSTVQPTGTLQFGLATNGLSMRISAFCAGDTIVDADAGMIHSYLETLQS